MPWKRRQCWRPWSRPRWGSQGRKGFTSLAGGKLYLKSPDFTMVYHYMLYIDAWRLLHLIEYPPLRDWWKFLQLISISNLYAESWLGPFDQETRGKQHCFTWPLNWFPTTKAQVWLRQATACSPWARLWMRMVSPRWSKDIADPKKEDTSRSRHCSCLMFSWVYLCVPVFFSCKIKCSIFSLEYTTTLLQCVWNYELSASRNLALSSAHAEGRSNSLENFVFDNLLLNVHKTHFQVGAPICQKCLGL